MFTCKYDEKKLISNVTMLQRNLYVFSWEIGRERKVERPQSSRKKNHKFSGFMCIHTTIVIQKIVYWFEIFFFEEFFIMRPQ